MPGSMFDLLTLRALLGSRRHGSNSRTPPSSVWLSLPPAKMAASLRSNGWIGCWPIALGGYGTRVRNAKSCGSWCCKVATYRQCRIGSRLPFCSAHPARCMRTSSNRSAGRTKQNVSSGCTRRENVWCGCAWRNCKNPGLAWGMPHGGAWRNCRQRIPHGNWEATDPTRFPPGERRHIVIDIAPRKRRELVQWLKQPPAEYRPFHGFYEDTWHEICRTHLLNSLYALCDLAKEGSWPTNRWQEALRVWSEKDRLLQRSWRYAAPLVQTMPDDALNEIADDVTWWLRDVSQSITRHESILLNLCDRVLELPLEPGSDNNSETIKQPLIKKAINHPIGHVTQALLNLYLKRAPNDNDGLPADIKPFFTQICDTQVDLLRHGRVLLASRSIALFRADRSWTEQHLLPLFQWTDNPVQAKAAKAAWEGFL